VDCLCQHEALIDAFGKMMEETVYTSYVGFGLGLIKKVQMGLLGKRNVGV